ncbi:hypothetical protein [uncultured Pseudokineococcus sp.]|uniref:hypothetical protein n=1 Tax=uncultured Pseudokineococcus sp. TaxID=1642928 RepID=UPI0026178797|nr:hypothetical protein [uncultured Pseudokineococcus sp.]
MRHPSLLAHVVVVAVPTVLSVAAWVAGHPDEDANIGAGLAGSPLIPLGLPWSLAAFVPALSPGADDGAWPPPVRVFVIFYAMLYVPAWINVVLHAWVLQWRDRRRAASAQRTIGAERPGARA